MFSLIHNACAIERRSRRHGRARGQMYTHVCTHLPELVQQKGSAGDWVASFSLHQAPRPSVASLSTGPDTLSPGALLTEQRYTRTVVSGYRLRVVRAHSPTGGRPHSRFLRASCRHRFLMSVNRFVTDSRQTRPRELKDLL